MRLICLELHGYRRFAHGHLDLDDEIIALVGPNEAGKSSILSALLALGGDDPIPKGDLQRGFEPTDGPVLSALYLLEREELQQLAPEYQGGSLPRWLRVDKWRSGKRQFCTQPEVKRSRAERLLLRALIEEQDFDSNFSKVFSADKLRLKESRKNVPVWMKNLRDGLAEDSEVLPPQCIEAAQRLLAFSRTLSSDQHPQAIGKQLKEHLDRFLSTEGEVHPGARSAKIVRPFLPDILLFRAEDRILKTEYSFSEALAPQGAIANLLGLVDLPLDRIRSALESGDPAQRIWLQEKANLVLRKRLKRAWTQAGVELTLQIDADVLRILVASEQGYSLLAERSDGLRLFIALLAFVEAKRGDRKPILLVDEAEAHLHYDAQVDLVRMMEMQEEAQQIIYSTHSAACLPSDLGRGVRAVQPNRDGTRDLGTSSVLTSVWLHEGGFSPLMTAMGANALAVLPARYAVLAEGAADVILLPSLLRAAVGRKLRYQLAPGLAAVSAESVLELELEAPRLTYLVDGDAGGERNAAKLLAAGVPEARLVRLPAGTCPEDFVDSELYLSAINEQLRRSHGDEVKLGPDALDAVGRPSSIAKACAAMGRKPPAKMRIAVSLVQKAKGENFLDKSSVQTLVDLNFKIEAALGLAQIPEPPRGLSSKEILTQRARSQSFK